MKTRLSFVDRIKGSFRLFRDDKNVALNKAVSHDIEVPPSSIPVRKRDAGFAIGRAIASRNQIVALLMSGETDRGWSANVKSGNDGAQTPSNLG